MLMRYVIIFIIPFCMVFMLWGCGSNAAVEFQTDSLEYEADGADSIESQSPATASEAVIYVDVCGEVNRPGVYRLSEQSRVCDAISAAGGFTDEAATASINQARLLSDGEQLVVPSSETAEQTELSDGLVNINTADVSELCTLPGIGEVKAADIVAYRQEHGSFQSIEELMQVPGIKEGLFQTLKDKIKI